MNVSGVIFVCATPAFQGSAVQFGQKKSKIKQQTKKGIVARDIMFKDQGLAI